MKRHDSILRVLGAAVCTVLVPAAALAQVVPSRPSGIQLAFLTGGRLVAAWIGGTAPGGSIGVFGRLFELT